MKHIPSSYDLTSTGRKNCSEQTRVRNELLVSLTEAKSLLGTTGKHLTETQIRDLSEFTEHLGMYFVELYLHGNLA